MGKHKMIKRVVLGIVLLMLAACAQPMPDLPPVPNFAADMLDALRFKTVLIAGDSSIPVFDNAVDGMAQRLIAAKRTRPDDIIRLSAMPAIIAQPGVRTVSAARIVEAVESLKPAAGEGCMVFATSHGGYNAGLYLSPFREFLTPASLDAALVRGCGNAPSVVVISGCFTGSFAKPPMTRANRIILTAAREDLTSFGCGAGREFTVYDACLLATMDKADNWRTTYVRTRMCVVAAEAQEKVAYSDPQEYFGAPVQWLSLKATKPVP